MRERRQKTYSSTLCDSAPRESSCRFRETRQAVAHCIAPATQNSMYPSFHVEPLASLYPPGNRIPVRWQHIMKQATYPPTCRKADSMRCGMYCCRDACGPTERVAPASQNRMPPSFNVSLLTFNFPVPFRCLMCYSCSSYSQDLNHFVPCSHLPRAG
jgi:hypothetical protein